MTTFQIVVAVLFLAIVGCGCLALLLANLKEQPLPRWVTCPTCNGTGRIHSSTCGRCNATGEIENPPESAQRLSQPADAPELIAALWSEVWRGQSVSTDALRQAIESRVPRSSAIDAALHDVMRRCDEWNIEITGRQFGHSRSAAFGRVRDAIDQLSVLVTGAPASTKERAMALAVAAELMAGPPAGTDLRTFLQKDPPKR